MMTLTFFAAFVTCLALPVVMKRRQDENRRQRITTALRRAIRDGVVGEPV